MTRKRNTIANTEHRGSVLLVANDKPDVGIAWWLLENFWLQLSRVANTRGLEPIIVYPFAGELPDRMRAAGIRTVVDRFPGTGFFGLLRSLRFIVRHQVRCVYFTDQPFTSYKYVLFRLLGVRLIVNHAHTPGDRPPIRGLKGFLKHVWRRIDFASCDLQLCVSPVVRERAIAHARIPAEKAILIQNGIEPIEGAADRGYARRLFNIPGNALICINVGRADPYKRIDFIIDVAHRCIIEHGADNLYFLHCGDGPDLWRLKSLAAHGGIANRFIFAGKRSDVRELLCSAGIAIHAPKGEAFSPAVLESMSAGLAVLVPDIPSVRQAVRDGETGIVYSAADVEGAATAILQLCAKPAYRRRLGADAAAEVRRNYSLAVTNKAFRRVIASALAAHGFTTAPMLRRRRPRPLVPR